MEEKKHELAVIDNGQINGLVSAINETYPAIKQRAERGVMALSKVTIIQNDEDDKIANDLLVKARATIQGGKDAKGNAIPGIMEKRMDITRTFDEFKVIMMQPEKLLLAEAERVGKLRNKYATEKAEKIRIEQERIAKERARNDEVSRLKASIRSSIVEGVVATIEKMNRSIQDYFNTITLETFDQAEKRFKIKPNLKLDIYESFFNVPYDKELVSDDMAKAIRDEIQKEESYEAVNKKYIESAERQIKLWADDLPKKKADLERVAELAKTNAIEAEKERIRQKEEEERKQAEYNTRMKAEAEARQAEIERQQNEEKLQNDFNAQVQTQAGDQLTGVRQGRVAIIDCPPEEIVVTLSKILLACYGNPKFPGHFKRDRKGNIVPPDENGNPVYAAWLQPLLNFVAEEVDTPIPGVVFKNKISAISK